MVQNIVNSLREYDEGRFTVKIPEGWRIMTQGDGNGLCLKVWDYD